MNIAKKIFQNIIELVFPSNCFGCDIEGVWICKDCLMKIPIYSNNTCLWCGKHLINSNICISCQAESQLNFLFAFTTYQNPIFKKLLHNFKYNFASDTINSFTLLLDYFFKNQNISLISKDSIIVPIPLHKKRFAERGFNQSELIGKQISQILQIQMNSKLLVRTKNTKSQMTLTKKERILNMKNSFYCPNINQIRNKNIILVDDVLTTGATLKEASLALQKAGCDSVSAFVLAKEGLINPDKNRDCPYFSLSLFFTPRITPARRAAG